MEVGCSKKKMQMKCKPVDEKKGKGEGRINKQKKVLMIKYRKKSGIEWAVWKWRVRGR